MSIFKLQVGNRLDISVETIQRDITLPQYIRSKVDLREVLLCVMCVPISRIVFITTSPFLFMQDVEDPFYVVDLGCVFKLHTEWTRALPSVRPFYAVKCNGDRALLKTLAALGTGFDCASKVRLMAGAQVGW